MNTGISVPSWDVIGSCAHSTSSSGSPRAGKGNSWASSEKPVSESRASSTSSAAHSPSDGRPSRKSTAFRTTAPFPICRSSISSATAPRSRHETVPTSPSPGFGARSRSSDSRPTVHAPFLLRLLGIDEGTERLAALTPDRIKSGIFEALCQMTLMSSKKRPVVLLAGDLHWIDATSEEFVQLLADAVPGAAMLLLMTYRPGYRPPRLEKSCATQLALRSLSTEDSRRIVSSAARDETMDDTVVDTILGKAEGNAFFLEELTRAVLEQKTAQAGSLTVPGTVQAVLRSEEHTSELQSQSNLVCRLLLEKKKKKITTLPKHDP